MRLLQPIFNSVRRSVIVVFYRRLYSAYRDWRLSAIVSLLNPHCLFRDRTRHQKPAIVDGRAERLKFKKKEVIDCLRQSF